MDSDVCKMPNVLVCNLDRVAIIILFEVTQSIAYQYVVIKIKRPCRAMCGFSGNKFTAPLTIYAQLSLEYQLATQENSSWYFFGL